jgi:putative membrane protein
MRAGGLSTTRAARVAAFLALAFFLSWLMEGGRISLILHPRMGAWVWAAGLVLLALALVQLARIGLRPREADPPGFYLALLFAMAVVFLAASPRDAGLAPRGEASGQSASEAIAVQKAFIERRDKAEEETSTGPLPRVIILDDGHYWGLYNRLYDDPLAAAGHRIEVAGFLVRDGRLPPGSALVARNLMWCCSADMTQIGFIAEGEGIESLPEGAWVKATGSLSSLDFDFDGDGKPSPIPVISLDGLAPVQAGSVSSTIFPY